MAPLNILNMSMKSDLCENPKQTQETVTPRIHAKSKTELCEHPNAWIQIRRIQITWIQIHVRAKPLWTESMRNSSICEIQSLWVNESQPDTKETNTLRKRICEHPNLWTKTCALQISVNPSLCDIPINPCEKTESMLKSRPVPSESSS